jgi:regulatory protein
VSARQKKASSLAELEKLALGYLNRFDCTSHKLAAYLRKNADRTLNGAIGELIARYQASGLVSDERFAASAVRRLTERGGSARAIAFKLGLKGVPQNIVSEALEARSRETAEPDLEAAKNLVRRRRLGPFRPESERVQYRRRDLAALARAGFDFDTARRALGGGGEEGDF